MKLKLNQKGFSMMELLIALAVLALTAVPVYSIMVVAAQYVGENDMRADCLLMAEKLRFQLMLHNRYLQSMHI